MGQIATPFVLSEADQTTLNQFVSKGKESVRKLNRVRALQFSHQGIPPSKSANCWASAWRRFIICENATAKLDWDGQSVKKPDLASLVK